MMEKAMKENEGAMMQLQGHLTEMQGHIQTLTQKALEFKQLVLCQQCSKRLKSVLFLPCMHFLFCSECAKELKRKRKQARGRVAKNTRPSNKENCEDEDGNTATKTKHFRCPKCGCEVRGRMKCRIEDPD